MPFEIDRFIQLRPFVYHVTHCDNIPRLRKLKLVEPAAEILRASGNEDLIRRKRGTAVPVEIERQRVVLNDQIPLNFKNIELSGFSSDKDLIEFLNRRVFFWPGDAGGPVKLGANFVNHYRDLGRIALKVPTCELIDLNGDPLFCHVNFGAPRMQHGKRVVRSPDFFQPCDQFPRTAGKVVEVAFRWSVHLPTQTVGL